MPFAPARSTRTPATTRVGCLSSVGDTRSPATSSRVTLPRSTEATVPALTWMDSFPAGTNQPFLPESSILRSASSSGGAQTTRWAAEVSAGRPGITWTGAGSAEAGTQSAPLLPSAACRAAPTRPERATTCTARSATWPLLMVGSRTDWELPGATVMPLAASFSIRPLSP